MAGDWIKMRGALVNHPKVIAMARHLHDHRPFREWLTPGGAGPMNGQIVSMHALRCVTTSLLMCCWSGAREHGKWDGDDLVLRHSTVGDLDEMAGAPGVGAAMEAVGWVLDDGGLRLPNFKEFNVPMSNAERQAEHRQRKKTVTTSLQSDRYENTENVTPRVERENREAKAKEIVQPAAPAAPVPDRMPDDIAKPAGPEARAKPRKPQTADRFAEFWAVYPVKKGKADALRHWKAQNLDPIADRIIEHVRRMEREDQQWRDGFIPHGSTYINGKRWEDEPVRPVDPRAATAPAPQKMGAAEALKQTETPLQRALGYLKHQHDLGAYGEGVAGEEAYQRLVEEAHAKHGPPPRVL